MVKHYVVTEGEIKKFKWGFEAWPYWEKHGGTHCYITQETGGDYELNAYRNGKPEVIGNYTTLQAAEDYLPKIK